MIWMKSVENTHTHTDSAIWCGVNTKRNLWKKQKKTCVCKCNVTFYVEEITFLKGYFTAILCAFSLPFGVKMAEVWQLRLTRPIWFLLGRKYCSWQGKHFARIKCQGFFVTLNVSCDCSPLSDLQPQFIRNGKWVHLQNVRSLHCYFLMFTEQSFFLDFLFFWTATSKMYTVQLKRCYFSDFQDDDFHCKK